jgi:hypothetical protein
MLDYQIIFPGFVFESQLYELCEQNLVYMPAMRAQKRFWKAGRKGLFPGQILHRVGLCPEPELLTTLLSIMQRCISLVFSFNTKVTKDFHKGHKGSYSDPCANLCDPCG